MNLKTCVSSDGTFRIGLHRPQYTVANLRQEDHPAILGRTRNREPVENRANFPPGQVTEAEADPIFEIPNAFPFRGATFISRKHADGIARQPEAIALPPRDPLSFCAWAQNQLVESPPAEQQLQRLYDTLPEALQLALAVNSNDPRDLTRLAQISAEILIDPKNGRPIGLAYDENEEGQTRPVIKNHRLFKAVANNPSLPPEYKTAMVLTPGVQGNSEIMGDWRDEGTPSHVYEYLRRNSYIPWGHYAANMADDAIRYRLHDLSEKDIRGLRHLYYQRVFVWLAAQLGLETGADRRGLTETELEGLRCKIKTTLKAGKESATLPFNRTLWGWNFGFDFSPSGYRLNASHQQIHQQYALIPKLVAPPPGGAASGRSPLPAYAYGDQVSDFIARFRKETGKPFFDCYLQAIRGNRRTDGGRDRPASLAVYEDRRVILFVPKAQTSQWELQLMPKLAVGNVLEADTAMRQSLDRAMYVAVTVLESLGARMITSFEFSKAFESTDTDQRLLYSFLPRIPETPGAFSEAQLRWISRHYPEDFAIACRRKLPQINKS